MFAHRYPNCWSEEKLGKPWIGTLVQCLPLSKEKWTWSGVELTVRTGGFLQANALDTSKKSESLILKNQHLVIKIISLSLCVQILEIKNLILTNEKTEGFIGDPKPSGNQRIGVAWCTYAWWMCAWWMCAWWMYGYFPQLVRFFDESVSVMQVKLIF